MYVVSEGFPAEIEKMFKYDMIEYCNRMQETSEVQSKNELVIVNDTNHYHQCDAIILVPGESALRSMSHFQLNYQ